MKFYLRHFVISTSLQYTFVKSKKNLLTTFLTSLFFFFIIKTLYKFNRMRYRRWRTTTRNVTKKIIIKTYNTKIIRTCWWTIMCLCRLFNLLNSRPHTSQSNFFSGSWYFLCILRSVTWVKVLWHMSHTYLRCSLGMCDSSCIFRLALSMNRRPQ